MEFDDLKHVWQTHHAASLPTDPRLDGARIRELLRTRSHSALAKLRHNMLLEAVSSVVGIPVLLYWSWHADFRLQVLLWLAASLAGGFSVVLLGFRWRVGSGPEPGLPLAEQLRSTVRFTERYLRLYEQSVVWLTLTALTLGLGLTMVLGSQALHAVPQLPRPGWRFLLLTATSFVIGYFITAAIFRVTLRIFYGRHLDTLRACLAELEEAPAA